MQFSILLVIIISTREGCLGGEGRGGEGRGREGIEYLVFEVN